LPVLIRFAGVTSVITIQVVPQYTAVTGNWKSEAKTIQILCGPSIRVEGPRTKAALAISGSLVPLPNPGNMGKMANQY
jgi:hypothetical protein